MSDLNNMRTFDWEDEIEKDDQFIVLEEGDYEFTVVNFERGLQDKTAKLPQCNKAIITLKVGEATIVENFPLCASMEWKASGIFRAVGLKKHGEKLKMNWPSLIGKTGKCHIKKTQGTQNSDTYFNNVDKYYDYVETKPAASSEGGGIWN